MLVSHLMRDLWLNLAAITLLSTSGCFGSHGDPGGPGPGADGGVDSGTPDTGRPDTGPPADAGPGCDVTTPFIEALACPASVLEGTPAIVTLTVVNGGCCGGGETFTEVLRSSDGGFLLESTMVVCDCCEACDCIGPIETTTVDLGALSPGSYPVQAGDQRCVIEVVGATSCGPHPTTELRMPRAIFPDQELPLSLIARDVSGCGCTPRIRGTLGDPAARLSMEVCDCCEDCRCIDPGYEASEVRSAPPPGEHLVSVDGLMPRYVSVRERDTCRAGATPTGLRIERPTDLIHSGPAMTWAVLTGEASVCCVEPMYAVESRRSAGVFELTIHDCTPEVDCACVPPGPTSFEAWHALGELTPGTYVVRGGGTEQTFTID